MNSHTHKTDAIGIVQNKDPLIVTNLWELIEAIGDEVQPGEEDLIPAVIVHLIENGKLDTLKR
jgi:hypothetical protein